MKRYKEFNNVSGIYLIIRRSTGQMYVGQSIVSIYSRWKGHKTGGNSNSRLDAAMVKYGEEDFELKLLEDLSYIEDDLERKNKADELESYYIQKYNTFEDKFHYNQTPGGDFNPMLVPEIREKSSESHKGEKNHNFGKSLPKETREKISIALKGKYVGKKSKNYGKTHSEESKLKMSKYWKKYYKTHEHPWKGRKHTQETKDKISAINRGENSYWYGKHRSEETKKKISLNNAKYWEGKTRSDETRKKISESKEGLKFSEEVKINKSKSLQDKKDDSTGFYRVHKKCVSSELLKYVFIYTWWEDKNNRGDIRSYDINQLKNKVLEKGFLWKIIDEEKAEKTMKFNEINKRKWDTFFVWDKSKVKYRPIKFKKSAGKGLNPVKCFTFKFNNKEVKCCGFNEYLSPTIIHDLSVEFAMH